jgi:stage II sporulation protein AA (anti-sigma F factor antagonist)
VTTLSSAFGVIPLQEPRSYKLSGELDISTADDLTRALRPDCETPGDITLDLSGLTFVDSSGLVVFLDACKRLGMKGDLVLRNASGEVAQLFDIAGLDRVEGLRVER